MAFDLASILGANLGDAFKEIMSVFKVDPTTALQTQEKLQEIQLGLQGKLVDQITAQIQVNQAEATSTNLFVAGWRPWCGWVCGIGLFFQFVVGPIGTWIAALAKHPVVFPTLDMGTLLTLLLGMLGLGGMRTYEKIQGAPGSGQNL